MDDKSIEERELVPGTNIPKPRYRDSNESDEDYVAYLKDYYSKYFPEIGYESVEFKNTSVANESNDHRPVDEHKTDDDIFSFDLSAEKETSESKKIISDEEESSYIPFDISAISQEKPKEEIELEDKQKKLENYADKMIKFDTNAISADSDAVEVRSITESNNSLKLKAKSPMLWQKAKNFFSNIKAGLVEKYELAVEKANDYFENNNDFYNVKDVAFEGRAR